jgi:ubiquinone/menaquinone biosynthesis C-methylase UbiE/uncharacterized protein YbaR (Trm112 family)
MDRHTLNAKNWLDKRFSKVLDGKYYAHQPIYGYGSSYSEPNQLLRFSRTYQLIKVINDLEFSSVLDVGGAEGYNAALIREIFQVPVGLVDLSTEACIRAREIYDLRGMAADSARLPFADNSYDLVVCSEVIEHLSRPILALSELKRVARKCVVVTTAEFCPSGEFERKLRLMQLDSDYPHSERNWFTPGDFKTLFGNVVLLSQMVNPYNKHLDNLDLSSFDKEQLRELIGYMTSSNTIDDDHLGVIAIICKPSKPITDTTHTPIPPDQLEERVFSHLLTSYSDWPVGDKTQIAIPVIPVGILACPACHSVIIPDNNSIQCLTCFKTFQQVDGIPVMLLEEEEYDLVSVQTRLNEAILVLSDSHPIRAKKIQQLAKYLHGKRPLSRYRWQRQTSTVLLRLLWLIQRLLSASLRLVRRRGLLTTSHVPGWDKASID